MDLVAVGTALLVVGALVLRFVLRKSAPESFDSHVDDALDIFPEELPQRTAMAAFDALPPCECGVCVDLTDGVVDFAFVEILDDALSPADLYRMARLGGLFGNPSGVQPPVIPGRDEP